MRRHSLSSEADFLLMAIDGYQLRLDAMQGQLAALRASVERLADSEDGFGSGEPQGAAGKRKGWNPEARKKRLKFWTPEERAKVSKRMKAMWKKRQQAK